MERQSIRWAQAKQELMKDFNAWINECDHTRMPVPEHMIEFLYQQGFIKGKKWRSFISEIAERNNEFAFWIKHEPLREGFIPPDTWV